MWRPNPLLRPVEKLQESIDRVVVRTIELLQTSLGERVELHHVGSTALLPLLTSGTVDILVLGEPEQLELLRSMTATIDDLNAQELPVRIEFADRHKPNNSLRIRHLLATSSIALGEFLALQKRFEHETGKGYPRAKNEFFAALLASPANISLRQLAFEQNRQVPHTIELRTKRLVMHSALSIHAEEYTGYLLSNQVPGESFRSSDPRQLEASTWRRFFAEETILRIRREQLTLLVRRKDTNALIGACNFFGFVWGRFQHCNVGFNLAIAEEGNGYMTEAVASAVHYVGEHWNVHRVQAFYDPKNTKSAQVLERVGFHVEGQMPSYIEIDGEWRDCVLAALHW